MLKQEELCGGSAVARCAKPPATTQLTAAQEPLSAQVSYPNQPRLVPSIKCKLSNIVQQRRTCGSHPAAGCSTGVCHRAAFQSPSNLSSSQLLKLSNCYRAAFIAAPFRRCAQVHCRRRQPPAASVLHTHRAACRTPNSATSHRTPPTRATSLATLQQQPAPPLHMPPLCTQQSHTASASAPAATHKGCHATQHLLTSQHLLQRRRRQPQN